MFAALAGLLGLEIKDRVSRLISAALYGIAALVFLITACAYLMSWVRFKLLMSYDLATVDLMLFGIFFVIAAGLGLAAYLISKPSKKTSTAAAALAAAPLAATVASSRLPSVVKAVPLVIIGGLLLGRHFANRE